MNTLESYAHKGLQSLRIGAINIKRVKFNTPFLYDFLGTLDICCSSDHWLHSFDLNFLDNLHPEFHAWGMSFPNEEDSVYCAPQYQRAVQQSSGVRTCTMCKNSNMQFASHHCMGISIDNSTFILSVYLPSRSGCPQLCWD